MMDETVNATKPNGCLPVDQYANLVDKIEKKVDFVFQALSDDPETKYKEELCEEAVLDIRHWIKEQKQ